MKKLVKIICIAFAVLMIAAIPLAAAKPYQTYTYSISGTPLYSPNAYDPMLIVDAKYMGVGGELVEPTDLEVDANENVYVVDSKANKVICLNKYYKLRTDIAGGKGYISEFTNEFGVKDSLTGPRGVFITEDGYIYVCDTERNRIVVFDEKGEYDRIISQPESELFDEGATYKPVAMAVDAYGRMFVVSESTTQGIIVLTAEGEFTKFIGAQKTSLNAWQIITRRLRTDEQASMTEANISVAYNNIAITPEGFIYVTTSELDKDQQQNAIKSKSTSGDYAPVKLLNASGDEIMRRNGFWPPSGEVQISSSAVDASKGLPTGASQIVDVACGPSETWSIIDAKRQKVFTYDFDGNLLFAFGDKGEQLGNLETVTAITYHGDRMLVLDSGTNKGFTVYQRTDYGNILITAIEHQNNRQYDKAVDDWQEILKRNSNFDAAYVGIGKAYYRMGENEVEEGKTGYDLSLEYYKAAYDTKNYSLSYKEIRKEWIGDFIILIPIGIGVLCFLISKLLGYANKVNRATALKTTDRTFKEELLYVFHVMFHPFDGFWDLKHEKRGSVRASIVFIALTILAYFYKAIGQGYILKQRLEIASLTTWIISVLVTVFLWAISNWCLTTLFDGEGKFKDIFIATSYCLLPVPITVIPCTFVSNFVLDSEVSMLSLVETIGIIYMVLLVFIGMMVTHDYSMGKNIITVAGTIVAMVFIMFVAVLFSTLLVKIVGFVSNIVVELRYRM